MTDPGVDAPRRIDLRQSFASLSVPAFRQWFLAQALSSSGSMTQAVAMSWLLLQLTGSGVDLGLISTFTFAPMFLVGPWAGAWVDRFDRRRLLIVTQSLFLAVSGLYAVLVATGVIRVWEMFAIALATGLIGGPDNTARQVYTVDLVGTDMLASAISLNEVVLNTSRVLGPAVGGLFLATAGPAWACAFNALTYIPPLVVLILHPVSRRAADEDAVRPRPFAGLAYALRHPALRVTVLMAAASGMLFGLNVTVPLLATRVFHLGGGGFGLLISAFGVGGIVGGVVASAGRHLPTGRTVAGLALATAAAILATAFSPWLGLAFVAITVTGGASIWFIARANALVLFATEPEMRGRVMGAWTMALPGTSPVTAPFVGWVADDVGPREGFAVAGVALALLALVGWRALGRPLRLSSDVAPPGARPTPLR